MNTDPTEAAMAHLRAFDAAVGPLGRVRVLREALDLYATQSVAEARAQGATWAEIGDALGWSRQRASRVFGGDDV